MIPAGDSYKAALRHSHESVIKVLAFDGSTEIGELPVISCALTLDAQADIQRSAVIRVAIDPLNAPTRDTLEALSVQQGIVEIWHGISGGGGEAGLVAPLVQLARLRIDAIDWNTTASFRTIKALDRALLCQEHKLPTGRPMDKPYVELIEDLLVETIAGETLTVDPGIDLLLAPTPGKAMSRGDDRLRRMQDFAAGLGAWLVNDPDGSFRLSVWPETGDPVWTINEGTDGVLVDAAQLFSRREQYNAVGIEFTPADETADFRGFVYMWDNDPLSPTYYDGPFGKRNIFFTEAYDHLPTTVEAEAIARRKLLEFAGRTREVELTAIYNPLLLPGDRIEVKVPDQESEVHVCERLNVNFGTTATMDVETRLDRDISTIGVL